MFDKFYDDWVRKKIKTIIDYYGYKFFYYKKILDLGAGNGDIAAAFTRLGADVLCVDARQENLNAIKKKYPFLKTMKLDLDKEWPFATGSFDFTFSLGLLCHLKNHQTHIDRICNTSEHIVLETEVLDTPDLNVCINLYQDKNINHMAFNGEGSIVSAGNIQNRLSELSATFKRIDEPKLNSGIYLYNWQESDSGRKYGNRRFWFIRRDKFIVKKVKHHEVIQEAENQFNPINMIPELLNRPLADASTQLRRPKFRLFYNYYEDKDLIRKKEIDFCLQKNTENPLFETIILSSNATPTYNFFFERINQIVGPDDISIICNSDIFFDDTIYSAANIGPKDFYALSRWEWNNGNSKLRDLRNSQDAWIMRGRIENINGNIPLGKPFCDNRIAFEFSRAGYRVSNPSKTIKTYHVHESGIRRYGNNEKVPGEILFVETTTIPFLPVPAIPPPLPPNPDPHGTPSIFALTSMSPRAEQFKVQKESIDSWIRAGCRVISFQCPDEIKHFNPNDWQGVQFIAVEPSRHFRPFIPIERMARWVEHQEGFAMIINADCRLNVSPDIMQNFANISKDGLVYLVRHDVNPNGQSVRQIHGMDAFIFPTKYSNLIPGSDLLCMGKPWWDWALPLAILRSGKTLASPSFPVLYHTVHPMRWSGPDHTVCRNEAIRLLGWKGNPSDMRNEISRRTRNFNQ